MTTSLPAPRAAEGTVVRLLKNPMGAISIAILAVMMVLAFIGPMIAPIDPNYADVHNLLGPPSSDNLLGTDGVGRDVWSRLLSSTQLTIFAATLCLLVAMVIGIPFGLVAGYYSGKTDVASSWVVEVLMSLPSMIVLLAARAALGPSVWIAMAILGVLLSPTYYRLTRAIVKNVRNELYVDAARVSGLSDLRIIARHILSVVRAPLIIQMAMVFGIAIAVQSSLEFLGLGDPLASTWGSMLGDGFAELYRAPILILWPALAIGLTTGALVLFGNALRDTLEDRPTAKRRRRAKQTSQATSSTASAAVPVGTRDEGEFRGTLLSVNGLSIEFDLPDGSPKRVVDGVSFAIDKQEVVALVGESGSGKTQTAFAILGLLADEAHVASGSIVFDGVPVRGAGASESASAELRGRRISYIPQEPMSNLDPNYTVGHQLTRPMVKVLGISKGEARKRALALLDRVGLPDPQKTFDSYPHEVSGGQAQRVLIAGAVSCEPELVIADEPTTALDVTVQAEVLDLLRGMKDEFHVGVLMVTHNFGVVADIADRVVVMQTGTVVEQGETAEILHRPQHPYTQMLIGSMIVGRTPLTPLMGEAS